MVEKDLQWIELKQSILYNRQPGFNNALRQRGNRTIECSNAFPQKTIKKSAYNYVGV